MNTAKHLNGLSSPPLRRKRFPSWIKSYVPAILFASLLGTYLDLYFVQKQIYEFPLRFKPEVFTINIVFTLLILPIFVCFYLFIMNRITPWGRAGFILLLSLLMPIVEKFAEICGLFSHSKDWKHIYTFFGYLVFLTVIYAFHQWLARKAGE